MITAGDGLTRTGTGSLSSPYKISADISDDADNNLIFGTDRGLFVPTPHAPVVGCGLTGDGTAGAPITAVPAGGREEWPWACDAATESTLKCDPTSGALWAPPDHVSAADRVYVDHFAAGGPTLGTTGGWKVFDPNANAQFNVPANFLGNKCRTWSYLTVASGTWDVSFSADAEFELGYVLTVDGGDGTPWALWGILTPPGVARRERDSGVAFDTAFGLDPALPRNMVFYPAANVIAGSVTINGWSTDAAIHSSTNTP
ncbi:hypothetical protein [Embleya sp. AB8]|uniref:hypothetical protein n=1 Tax=Embleya sp. AB8 TaxID=3156304 RepID=UPI003C75CE0A